jgi:hypothetical protein
MTYLSRVSEPAVYVASIAIHASGIILLFQYLFMRNTCTQCNQSNRQGTEVSQSLPRSGALQRNCSDYSTTSDEYTRKQRRPYTTYGGGGDFLRRESSRYSWESTQTTTVDRTASGRKIPPRSPIHESRPDHMLRRTKSYSASEKNVPPLRSQNSDSRPKTADGNAADRLSAQDLKRSKSYSGRDDNRTRRQDEDTSSVSVLTMKYEEAGLKSPTLPVRQNSGRKLRKRVDQIRPNSSGSGVPPMEELPSSPTVNQFKDSINAKTAEETPPPILRPVLLPPLTDSRQSWSSSTKRSTNEEAISTPSSSRSSSEKSDSVPSSLKPRSILKSVPSQSTNEAVASTSQPASSSPSDFVFPFQPNSAERSHVIQYEEDYSNWRPRNELSSATSSAESIIMQMQSWPLQLEDLIGPDPPFASEDRPYFCTTPTDSRPSESRLSTITEEGTIRDSVAATPPNIIITDTSHHARESSHVIVRNVTPLSPTMVNWISQGGAQYDVDAAMNRLGKSPSPIPPNNHA